MKYYVGIDLGTTNSAICTYDGKTTRIWKSPDVQADVTPSAIYVDRRGNRYYGFKAYNQAPYNPLNSATLFKRYMGTNTKIMIKNLGYVLTPEECSAEILKVLYGYLPEEIRNDSETATVITVPAAFNQMKKDATMQAAQLAGLGKVSLMQEPVAAIMSIMKSSKQNGIFLVYDLGGGTFDISIAQNLNGKVNLLAHGGIEMCGGRDIDCKIFDQLVVPWIIKTFDVPDDFINNERYSKFCRVAQWATERAKIELSSRENVQITLTENEAMLRDESSEEIYLDLTLNRLMVNGIIEDIANETINATKDIISKNGLTEKDVETVVFVGGPTNYKPLRDKVSAALSLKAVTDVNSMTAVVEGASIFAESIDWSSISHERKVSNVVQKASVDVDFKYTARASGDKAKVMCLLKREIEGYSIEFSCVDTGWTSGRAVLKDKQVMNLPLSINGNNTFTVVIYDEMGMQCSLDLDKIVIMRTIASILSIPASHSIGIEVLDSVNGKSTLDFLIKEGDSLPHIGKISFKAGQTISSGSESSINIRLWEGDILEPISDNRFIGVLKVKGRDVENGVISVGAAINCEYEISDSGNVNLEVSIPSVGMSLSGKNFYSREEGQIDLTDIESVVSEGRHLLNRIQLMKKTVSDERLDRAWIKAEYAARLDSSENNSLENVQKANNELLEVKKLMYKARIDNLTLIRQSELESSSDIYYDAVEQFANEKDKRDMEKLFKIAQKSIDRNDTDFESILEAIDSQNFHILVQEDWFIVDFYKNRVSNPSDFSNNGEYLRLKALGDSAMNGGNISQLRKVIDQLGKILLRKESLNDISSLANILRG